MGMEPLVVERTRLRETSFDEATAFGVWFGVTETLLLGPHR